MDKSLILVAHPAGWLGRMYWTTVYGNSRHVHDYSTGSPCNGHCPYSGDIYVVRREGDKYVVTSPMDRWWHMTLEELEELASFFFDEGAREVLDKLPCA